MELLTVPGENNTRRLAREVKASFQLPWQMHELESKEAPFQAPLVLPCLHRRRFMPPVISIFASQDIREIPWERTIAYAWALQHWAKQNSLPVRGKPRLLVESVLELRKEVDFYLSFTEEEVFQGVVLPKEEGEGRSLNPSIADALLEHCTFEPMPEEKVLQHAGWEKVLHPSWPVVAPGETPQPTRILRLRGRSCPYSQMKPMKSPIHIPEVPSLSKPSSSTKVVASVKPSTLPCSFKGVTACLKMPEVSVSTLSMGLAPGMSSMSSSCVMKDNITGVTYMDTVTTSFGRIIISDPNPNASSMGPVIEDITDRE